MGLEDDYALVLERAYGASCNVRGGLVNLSTATRSAVCFIAAHVAIIQDIETGEQRMLQGHCNPLCGLATNPARSLVVSADIGPDSMIIIWDAHTGEPLHTVPSPTPYGFRSIDVSSDGTMIAAVTAPPAQQVHVWELGPARSGGILASHLSAGVVRPGDTHRMIRFASGRPPSAPFELVTQGRRSVAFWSPHHAAHERLVMAEPTLNAADFQQTVGEFTMSAFVPHTPLVCTGTVDGDIVVWAPKEGSADALDRLATKVIRVHSAPVTFLTTVGQYLVTGGGEGFVRLFDTKLRIAAWFEDIGHGAITSVAFASNDRPVSPTIQGEDGLPARLSLPDFAVSTSRQSVVAVASASFETPQPHWLVVQGVQGQITALACHPSQPSLAVSTKTGRVERWDANQHRPAAQTVLPSGLALTALAFSRSGGLLVAGCASGHVAVLDSATLKENALLRNTRSAIVMLDAALGGDHIAAGDESGHLLLYALQRLRGILQWEMIGKFRGHGDAGLAGLTFSLGKTGDDTLLSMGRDGSVCEYDLASSSLSEGVALKRKHEAGKFPGRPSAVAEVRGRAHGGAALCPQQGAGMALLCADQSLKMRLLDVGRGKTTATVLGPTFGGPVRFLRPFVAAGCGVPCVAFAAEEKVCGVVVGPLDGCPSKTLGLIAHPGPISGIAVSHDGSRVYTASAEDPIINVWRVDPGAVADMSQRGDAVADWASAVEGGMQGELMEELLDTFYFCKVLAKQEGALTPAHAATNTVPASLVPDFLRTMGVFPSDLEMRQIMYEFKEHTTAHFAEEGDAAAREAALSLSFEDLLRIYVNNRPVGDVLQMELVEAFRALQRWVTEGGSDEDQDPPPQQSSSRVFGQKSERSQGGSTEQPDRLHKMDDLPEDMVEAGALYRARILEAIGKYGEVMKKDEQATVAKALAGAQWLPEIVPEVCDPHQFMEETLGFLRT